MPWIDVHTDVEIRLTRNCFRTYRVGKHNVPRWVAGKIVYMLKAGTFAELDSRGEPVQMRKVSPDGQ